MTIFSSQLRKCLGALAAAGLLGLCSCATTDSAGIATGTVPTPARWQQDSAAQGGLDSTALARWWERFNDPVLTELVNGALKTSPTVRTALAKIESARAAHRVQRANLLPSLDASASAKSSSSTDRSTDVTTTSRSASAGLDASWEIDLFGTQRKALDATAADLAEAEENLRDAQVSLAAEVASTYVTLRSAEAKLASVRQTLVTREQTLQLIQWQEQAGTGSALETQEAVSTVESVRASIPTLEQTVLETRNQLAVLCGQTPGALDAQLGSDAGHVPAAPAAIAVGIPAETLRQRPDVRSAGRAVEAAAARTESARRDRFPTLSLSGSLGVEALSAGKLFSPESSVASALGSLSAPIFAGGKIQQTIAVKAAAEKQALITYESTVLSALADVENALSSIKRNSKRLAALDKAAAAAREAATLAHQKYEAGQANFLTVLDADRSQLSLEQDQIAATADLSTSHVQLYKALGGGWSNL